MSRGSPIAQEHALAGWTGTTTSTHATDSTLSQRDMSTPSDRLSHLRGRSPSERFRVPDTECVHPITLGNRSAMSTLAERFEKAARSRLLWAGLGAALWATRR